MSLEKLPAHFLQVQCSYFFSPLIVLLSLYTPKPKGKFHMASLNEIIQNINQNNDNTKKGSMFEKLCLYFLMHDKIYAPKFSDIWLWSQWPGNKGMPDTGIDIVAKFTEGNSYCAVQCKFRQNDSSIPKAEIDSFMSISSKSIYSQRILFALTDDFNDKAKDTLTDQNPPVKVLTLQDLANSSIVWEEFSFENLNHVKYKVKALLPHQVTAVDDVLNGLAHHDRGKLIMACGTGKTFTSRNRKNVYFIEDCREIRRKRKQYFSSCAVNLIIESVNHFMEL